MNLKLSSLPKLFQSRLSRRIAGLVFTSLVAIELVILVPSYVRRENELLEQIEEVSEAMGKTTIRLAQQGKYDEEKIIDLINTLSGEALIMGGSIYRIDGNLMTTFGEKPQLEFADLKNINVWECDRLLLGDRYEVAWSGHPFGVNYVFIIRHDSSSVQPALYAYAARIAGLVLIIAIVVTSSTMFVLGTIVIVPILQLRKDLMLAADALSRETPDLPDFYALTAKRQDELGDVMQAFCQMFDRVYHEILHRKETEDCLRREQDKSERLLLNILPAPIADRLKQGHQNIADGFAEVTILFADLVGFTQLSSRKNPKELVDLLNQIFSAFDRLSEKHGLEKIKTIGDAYMVAGGLPDPKSHSAADIAEMAIEMQQEMQNFRERTGEDLHLRIGMNTGPVVAGVIGTRKFIYDLWGDAVNVASRMESQGIPGCIQVTEATYTLLKDKYRFEARGEIAIKGKGTMPAYLLKDRILTLMV
ncbi:MAG: adenylate/guanylate cyclase domain-containing protein [Geitlerinemataceae cyanobacterium]